MSAADAHHIAIGPEAVQGNGSQGRVFLLPGSPGRAERIADMLTGRVSRPNPRRHEVHTGRWTWGDREVDIGVVATGMGCPSLGIIVSELIAVGARTLLRVGTTGTLDADAVPVGSLILATGAVRDEGTSDALCPREVPAVAHPDVLTALSATALQMGLGERTYRGLVHCKDSFYGREVAVGPQAQQSAAYMAMLKACGVLGTEMESSHLFLLAQVHGPDRRSLSDQALRPSIIRAGTVLAAVGDLQGWGEPTLAARAEAEAIELALNAATRLT